METILYNISQVLGITVLHSLWQGLLMYFVLRIIFIAVLGLSPEKKYNLSIAAMVLLMLWFIYTLAVEVQAYSWASAGPEILSPLLPYVSLDSARSFTYNPSGFYHSISGYIPYVAVLYITGLLVNIAKLGLEWNKIRQIKQVLIPAGQMHQFINSFAKKLNITKHIQLYFSEMIDVPCMIGYFKPIILLPVSLATYLSADEVEAILLHELSHIKRNDYLVNLLQQLITVMLFFNPFAQLINRTINQERENSCDDLVVEKTGKPLIYAQALLKLEETKGVHLQLALAATGKKFYLLNRIERIMKTQKQIGNVRHLIIALFLLAGLSSIAWFNPKIAAVKAKILKPIHAVSTVNVTAPFLVNAIDSNKYRAVTDTPKHRNRSHIVIVDKNGKRKEYNSIDSLSPADRKSLDSITKFYSSDAWKKQLENMTEESLAMNKKFNSDEWKKQSLDMQKMGEEMSKKFNSDEWKKQSLDMQKMALDINKKFNSEEWKKQSLGMQKMALDMNKKFNSDEWKKQSLSMQKMALDMNKKFNSEEWKKQSLNLQKMALDMNQKFNSEEWKKQSLDMQKMGEEMSKKFNSDEWKKQSLDMQKMGEEMSKKFNSEEWKNMKGQKWILTDSVNDVKIYAPEKQVKKEKTTKKVKKEKPE